MKILKKAIILFMILLSLFYKSNVLADSSWELKTGNLYDLTSNTSWAEGTPLIQYSEGTGETLSATGVNSYLSFDNNLATKSTTPDVIDRLYVSIKWTKPRKLVKVTSSVYQSQNNNSIKIRKLYGIKEDNSTVLLQTKTSPLNSGDQTLNEFWNITDETEYYGLAIDIYENYQGRNIYLWELQVTKWYEYIDNNDPVDPTDPTPLDYTEVLEKLDSIDQNIKNNGSLTLSLVTLVSLFGLTILNIRWFGWWKK